MGFLKGQIPNLVEWTSVEDTIAWKWPYDEIKKGSKLVIRPGQDAIFLYNGKIEGIFEQSGDYDIESQIIPFLTTLKNFKFGFSTSGMKSEVLFINTNLLTIRWGTKSPVNIECRVREVHEYGSHTMFVADVLCVHADEKYMNETGKFELENAQLLAYSHGTYYGLTKPQGTFGYSVKKKEGKK